jgi:hypothetical protein
MYYYDDYEYVYNYLDSCNLENIYINNNYEKFRNKSTEYDTTIFIYKDINVIAIMSSRDIYINKLKGIFLLKKVNLLDKKIFKSIFEQDISKNLCNIKIDIDILGSEEELIEFEGAKLQELNLLEEYDLYDKESETVLKSYSIQPTGYKYALQISSVNKLQFSDRYNTSDIEAIISKLIIIIKLVKEVEQNIE